jgi:hypothetical protein
MANEKRVRNTKHIETIKQLDTAFYREGRPYRIFLNTHPRAKEFGDKQGCYVLCTSACSGSVTFVKATNTFVHEKIVTKVISLNTEEIDKYDITILYCYDDNDLLTIIDNVKAEPDKWFGMRDYEYVPGIDMPVELDPVPDDYVYVKGDDKIRLFERDQFDEYEFKLYKLQDLREGLYALIFKRKDGTTVVEPDCKLNVMRFRIDVKHIVLGGVHSEYELKIKTLISNYESLKIMSMKEYHEIMTEEKAKDDKEDAE